MADKLSSLLIKKLCFVTDGEHYRKSQPIKHVGCEPSPNDPWEEATEGL